MRTLPITREHTVQVGDVQFATPAVSVNVDPIARQNAAYARSEKMKAVQRDGGRAIAEAPSARDKMRRRLHGIGWQSLILFAAVVDISVLCVELGGTGGLGIDTLTGLVLFIFTIDIVLRLYTYRVLFFKRTWNYIDLLVLIASFALFLIGVSIDAGETHNVNATWTSNGYSGASSAIAVTRGSRALRGLLMSVRILRGLRVARTLVNAGRGTQLAARHVTGENKKRFVDLEENFDLDLVYITPGLIAMSVPATGTLALYRNPLDEVVRFFETRCARTHARTHARSLTAR